jgi:predicted Fe-Mo cluster-binding NifX family protein
MKVVVTATEPALDAELDPRFGRCAFFVVVETDDMSFEAIENSNAALGGGAGIQSAQAMADRGVKTVLTGNCGPNAHQTLSAAGIDVIVGCAGTVKETVERFKAGGLKAADQPSVGGHFGMGGGRGMGRGMGRGGGMGGGKNRS